MGGFIKCTLRDADKITTCVVGTDIINGAFSDYENIFENDIYNILKEKSIKKSEITKSYHDQIELIAPFDYGYLFIDRVNKKVFFLNNYDSISYFSNFDFNEDMYKKLKEQNYKIKIQNYKSKDIAVKDVRKEFVMRNFREYKKLFTAIPYIKTIKSINETIVDHSSLESILDKLTELRSTRTLKINDFINDLIITEFKEWDFIEDNKTKKSLTGLFEYLKGEDLLSEKDIQQWNIEIKESSDD